MVTERVGGGEMKGDEGKTLRGWVTAFGGEGEGNGKGSGSL